MFFPSISMPTQTLNTLIEFAQYCKGMLGVAHVWYLTLHWEEHHLEVLKGHYLCRLTCSSTSQLYSILAVRILPNSVCLNFVEMGLIESCCFQGRCLP